MANWRDRGFPTAHPPKGLVWAEDSTTTWRGMVDGIPRARLWHGEDGWQVMLQLETPAGVSPVTTLPDRYGTVEEAQAAAEARLAERFDI